jgi:hypothetical protein
MSGFPMTWQLEVCSRCKLATCYDETGGPFPVGDCPFPDHGEECPAVERITVVQASDDVAVIAEGAALVQRVEDESA